MGIWEAHFPADAPLGEDVSFPLLAERFQISGGVIRNIALNAAFLAAAEGSAISMKQIVHCARREYDKLGKMWPGGRFD